MGRYRTSPRRSPCRRVFPLSRPCRIWLDLSGNCSRGKWIRTSGSAREWLPFCFVYLPETVRVSPKGPVRGRGFESTSLQGRVRELSVPASALLFEQLAYHPRGAGLECESPATANLDRQNTGRRRLGEDVVDIPGRERSEDRRTSGRRVVRAIAQRRNLSGIGKR